MALTNSYDFRGTATALIVATPKAIHRIHIFTYASSPFWVKFFNKATAPVLGTDTPLLILPIGPALPINLNLTNDGWSFSVGIGIAFSGDFPALDTTPVPGGLTVGNVFYG